LMLGHSLLGATSSEDAFSYSAESVGKKSRRELKDLSEKATKDKAVGRAREGSSFNGRKLSA